MLSGLSRRAWRCSGRMNRAARMWSATAQSRTFATGSENKASRYFPSGGAPMSGIGKNFDSRNYSYHKQYQEDSQQERHHQSSWGQHDGSGPYAGSTPSVSETLQSRKKRRETRHPHDLGNVWVICLSGGPCGGKSSAVVMVADRLRAMGYEVFVVNELATNFFNSGCSFDVAGTPSQMRTWEAARVQAQMAMEDAFRAVAVSRARDTVILADRGTMDAKAYMDEEAWQTLLDEYGWSETDLRDARYDAVVHLTTAAKGAADYYTQANNAARRESVAEAIEVDNNVHKAWMGHDCHMVVDNSTDFDTKMRRVTRFICKQLGSPIPTKHRRIFTVDSIMWRMGRGREPELPIDHEKMHIESVFMMNLEDSKTDLCLRRCGKGNSYAYSISEGSVNKNNDYQITEKPITAQLYLTLLDQADPELEMVERTRYSFVHNGVFYKLDCHLNENGDTILIVEVPEDQLEGKIDIPNCIKIRNEITNSYGLRNYAAHSNVTGAAEKKRSLMERLRKDNDSLLKWRLAQTEWDIPSWIDEPEPGTGKNNDQDE